MTVAQPDRLHGGFFPRIGGRIWPRAIYAILTCRHCASVKALSRGARTKLALLLAFCRGAELIILDEATSGLDPMAAEEVLQALIGHVASEGTTVFFSSHQIAEIEQIADHVASSIRVAQFSKAPLDDLREPFAVSNWCSTVMLPSRNFDSPGMRDSSAEGRVLTVLASGDAEQIIEEARSFGSVSAEVLPITLKEIFLETHLEGALTCCGTRPGSTPAGGSSLDLGSSSRGTCQCARPIPRLCKACSISPATSPTQTDLLASNSIRQRRSPAAFRGYIWDSAHTRKHVLHVGSVCGVAGCRWALSPGGPVRHSRSRCRCRAAACASCARPPI